MRVKAIKLGYYNLKRVKPGMIFNIKESEFSERWMESLEGKPVKAAIGGSKKNKAPVVEEIVEMPPEEEASEESQEVI